MKNKLKFVILFLLLGILVLIGAGCQKEEGELPSGEEAVTPGWSTETVDTGVGFEGNISIAVDNNNHPHIAYYKQLSETPITGALSYAHWTGSSWDVQILEEVPDILGDVSIALDSKNHPHLSFIRGNTFDLGYAHWTGDSWDIQTVDYGIGTEAIFSATSIAVDSSGHPHISYYNMFNSDLKYAYWTGSSWATEIVDTAVPLSWGWTSIALDLNDRPHIGYIKYEDLGEIIPSSTISYAYWNGTSWQIKSIDSGAAPSIALDSSNYPYLSYLLNGILKYARWTGSSWDIQTVDPQEWASELTSIALDSSDRPHIGYYFETSQDLRYAHWTGDSWDIQTVDSQGKVGWDVSITVDSNDRPHIGYSDKTNTGIKYAKLISK